MANDVNMQAYMDIVNSAVDSAKEAANEAAAKLKGGGWMAAIAAAMSKALGINAGKLVGLSNAIAQNADARSLGTDEQANAKNAKLAAIGQALNGQFQAASQEMSVTSNALSTGLKALGEAGTTMARKN